MQTTTLKVTAVVAILLLSAVVFGEMAGDYLFVPSRVKIAGTVDTVPANLAGVGILYHSQAPSYVLFFYYSCQTSPIAACAHQYNGTVGDLGVYSVTVPNNHVYYIAVGGPNGTAEECHPMDIPLYSYTTSIYYNITAFCY
jgi:hypothetical protein